MQKNPLTESPHPADKPLRALYHLAVELSSLRSLDRVLNTALNHCLELTGSQFGFVGLTTDDGSALDVVAVQGFHPAPDFYERFRVIPLRPNLFAGVVLNNHAIRTDNALTDPRRVGQPSGHPPVTTFMGVPLQLRKKTIGMIGVANRATPYEDEHEQLISTYAAQIAIVIHNVRLYEELVEAKQTLEEKVQERTHELETAQAALAVKADQLQQLYNETLHIEETERKRIAQDMHDGVNQLLIGAMLEVKSARSRVDSGNLERAEESLAMVQDILRDVEAEINRIVYDIRPPTLDELGFVPTLQHAIQEFRHYSGLACDVDLQGRAVRLDSSVEVSIYRLLQEALKNVYNHAQATHVTVRIQFSQSALFLMIHDDGVGFDVAEVRQRETRHFGLLSMQERALNIGGKITVQTKPGGGTTITLYVPIENCNIE